MASMSLSVFSASHTFTWCKTHVESSESWRLACYRRMDKTISLWRNTQQGTAGNTQIYSKDTFFSHFKSCWCSFFYLLILMVRKSRSPWNWKCGSFIAVDSKRLSKIQELSKKVKWLFRDLRTHLPSFYSVGKNFSEELYCFLCFYLWKSFGTKFDEKDFPWRKHLTFLYHFHIRSDHTKVPPLLSWNMVSHGSWNVMTSPYKNVL